MTEAFDRARVNAICFDIDGTLINTDDSYVLRLARWLRPLTPLLPDRDVDAAARRWVLRAETPMNSLFAVLDRFHLDQVLGVVFNSLHRMRGAARQNAIALIPGVPATLECLSERYPLGVVTAREHSSAIDILCSHNLKSYFQCVATARTTLRAKPHPAPVLWAAEQLGFPSSEILMVGDTTVDILAGQAAGAQTAALLCGFGQRGELERAGADVILHEPKDLVNLLL
jgi:HAD superfamily hydrolase (TIGR01549 family)